MQKEDVEVMRQSLNRYAAMVKYYQSLQPHQTMKNSDIAQLQRSMAEKPLFEVLMPLIQSYDQQTAQSEILLTKFEQQLDQVERRVQQVTKENADLKQGEQLTVMLRERVDVLLEENQLLIEQQRRNEPLIQNQFELEKQLANLQQSAQRQESQAVLELSTEITALKLKHQQSEHELSDARKVIQSLKKQLSDNEALVQSTREQQETFQESSRKMRSWFTACKARIEEFEQCCTELNVLDWISDYTYRTQTVNGDISDGQLYKAVRKLKLEYVECKHKLSQIQEEHYNLQRKYGDLQQSYDLDTAKFESNVAVMKEHLEMSLKQFDQLQHERDSALNQARKCNDELGGLSQQLRDLTHKQRQDADIALLSTREQIQSVREQYELEKQALLRQISELHRNKADMQVEIGWLLRDKRNDFSRELTPSLRQLNMQSDRFKKEMLKL